MLEIIVILHYPQYFILIITITAIAFAIIMATIIIALSHTSKNNLIKNLNLRLNLVINIASPS